MNRGRKQGKALIFLLFFFLPEAALNLVGTQRGQCPPCMSLRFLSNSHDLRNRSQAENSLCHLGYSCSDCGYGSLHIFIRTTASDSEKPDTLKEQLVILYILSQFRDSSLIIIWGDKEPVCARCALRFWQTPDAPMLMAAACASFIAKAILQCTCESAVKIFALLSLFIKF